MHRQGQVGNLVQKKSAAVCALHQACFIVHSSRKAAFLMAEELALHEFGCDCATIDCQKGPFGARSAVVDQSGHQLFSRAGFAGNVHRRLRSCDFADHVTKIPHAPGISE